MTEVKDIPGAYRDRSKLDHRAIIVAGHLLLGIVWLERQIAYLPDQVGVLVERAGLSGPTEPFQRSVMTGPNERGS